MKYLCLINRESVENELLYGGAVDRIVSDEMDAFIRERLSFRVRENFDPYPDLKRFWKNISGPEFRRWFEQKTRHIPYSPTENVVVEAMIENRFDFADLILKHKTFDFYQSSIVKSGSPLVLEYATMRGLIESPWDSACAMWAVMGPQFARTRRSPYDALKWMIDHSIRLRSNAYEDPFYQYIYRKTLSDRRVLDLLLDAGVSLQASRVSIYDAAYNGNHVGYVWLMERKETDSKSLQSHALAFVKARSLSGLKAAHRFLGRYNLKFENNALKDMIKAVISTSDFNILRFLAEVEPQGFNVAADEVLKSGEAKMTESSNAFIFQWLEYFMK